MSTRAQRSACAAISASILALATSAACAAVPAAGTATTEGPSEPAASSGDPLQSPACRRAIATLSDEETAAAAAAHASGAGQDARAVEATLVASRRRAAKACLASRADPARPAQRLLQPPIAVAPPALPPTSPSNGPGSPSSARPSTPPAPPRGPERPYAITSCDAGGCWANDGTRLNRVGPILSGPHGACIVQGSLVQCP